jgi:hypothetical protein
MEGTNKSGNSFSVKWITLYQIINEDLVILKSANGLNNISNIRIVMESRLLRYKSRNFFADKKLCIYQNFHPLPSNFSKFKKFKTYYFNGIFYIVCNVNYRKRRI